MTSKSTIEKPDTIRLPNKVIFARDESAEKVNSCKRRMTKLAENYFKIDDSSRLQMLMLCLNDASDAIRYLEGIGAKTQP